MREFLLKEEKNPQKSNLWAQVGPSMNLIHQANQQTPWFWMCQSQNSLKNTFYFVPRAPGLEFLDPCTAVLGLEISQADREGGNGSCSPLLNHSNQK